MEEGYLALNKSSEWESTTTLVMDSICQAGIRIIRFFLISKLTCILHSEKQKTYWLSECSLSTISRVLSQSISGCTCE